MGGQDAEMGVEVPLKLCLARQSSINLEKYAGAGSRRLAKFSIEFFSWCRERATENRQKGYVDLKQSSGGKIESCVVAALINVHVFATYLAVNSFTGCSSIVSRRSSPFILVGRVNGLVVPVL